MSALALLLLSLVVAALISVCAYGAFDLFMHPGQR